MLQYAVIGQSLSLLVVASGALIIARNLLGKQGDWPPPRRGGRERLVPGDLRLNERGNTTLDPTCYL